MGVKYDFLITIDINAEELLSEKGPQYAKAFQESCDEFTEEFNEFLEKHPLVHACRHSKGYE